MTQQNFHKFFTFYFIVFGIVVSLFGVVVSYTLQIKDIQKDLDRKANEIFAIKNETILKPTIENIDGIAKSLVKNEILKDFIINEGLQKKDILELLFLATANSNNLIMQLRLIDKNGQELIKVNRNEENLEAFLVDKSSLQNRSDRDYFKFLSTALENTIWHSKLDLNINKEMDTPYKANFKIAMPLYYNNEFSGTVIINVLMNNLLRAISSSSVFEHYILDKENNYILHPNNEFSFNKYKQINKDIKEDFKEGLKTKDIYIYSLEETFKNNENAIMILKTKKNYQKEMLQEKLNTAIIVFSLTIFLSLIMALFVSKTPAELQKRLLKAYEKLDEFTSILNKYVITAKTKPDSTILEVSDAFERVSGYSRAELIGSNMSIIKNPQRDNKVINQLWENILNKKIWIGNIKNKKKTGEEYWLEQTIIPKLDENKQLDSFLAISIDITAKMELEMIASIDKLTNIYNRRMLDEFLKVEIEMANRHQDNLSLIIIDMDYFKQVNDTFGHLAGDKLLSQLAKLISDNLRASDIFGRYGGEEFLIICTQTNKQKAFLLAEKLRMVVKNFRFDEVGYKTISLGVSDLQKDDNVKSLFKKADDALYQAKNSGRDKSVVFEEL